MRKRHAGYLLLVTLGVLALLFCLGTAVVGFSTAHQSLVRKAEERARAAESARAGVEVAIARLRADPNWKEGFRDQAVMEAGFASLQFEPGDIPQSIHNGAGVEPVPGWDRRTVPTGTVHLVCEGRSGTSRALVQALVGVESILLDDQFDSGAPGWTSPNGSLPLVILGFYLLELGGGGSVLAGSEHWSDYEAEFVARLSQGTGLGFLARATGPPEAPDGYLAAYELTTDSFALHRMVAGLRGPALVVVPRADTALAGSWLVTLDHTYRLRVEAETVSWWVDGVQVLTFKDEQAPRMMGRIGVHPGLGAVVLLDRVQVRALFGVRSIWRGPT
ncbi:MAG: hypothetical protein HY319_14215 [Armatimonadetes bacterium]|nr:hypothetical protein [Armatimonadota bacterium]